MILFCICFSMSFLLFFFFLGLQIDSVQLACQKKSEWLDMYKGARDFLFQLLRLGREGGSG